MRKIHENGYGEILDRNGYAPSIIPDHGEHCCWMCGKNGTSDPLDRHEIFGGANRTKSKKLGLWVYLCHNACHLNGVHGDAGKNKALKQVGEYCAKRYYDWTTEEFIHEFGKNYED